jgi:molybdenum cofactor cytidylyltransferase
MRDVGAVILAAGGSTRLGQPKQLVQFQGESLVRRAARAVLDGGCEPVVVVVGELRAEIQTELNALDVRAAENREWQRGMGTSISCGVASLLQRDQKLSAVVLLACDQPFVDAHLIEKLIASWRSSANAIVASSYADTAGIPALFDWSCFESLLQLQEDRGAKRLIMSRASETALVPFPDGAVDIDTPADLARISAERL